VKCDVWNIASYGAETWTLQKVDHKRPWKFFDVMLKKAQADQLHRSF